jgi:small conductance mechanosensitive channel
LPWHFHLALLGADHAPTTLTGSCGAQPGLACRFVWDVSHNGRAAELTMSFLAGPVHLLLRILFVVIVALVVRYVLHRVINRLTERAAQSILPQLRSGITAGPVVRIRIRRRRARGPADQTPEAGARETTVEATVSDVTVSEATVPGETVPAETVPGETVPAETVPGETVPAETVPAETAQGSGLAGAAAVVAGAMIDERRKQRVQALGAILRSAASITIFAIAGVDILSDLGINLAPLLASAGVVGIAIGFGAQNLVRDYLSGIFMLLEDQYGVGDVVTFGDASGTVENVTLRITRLRDTNGVLWHIRNGSIEQVGNESQGWARAVIDYPVPYETDLATITGILSRAAQAMWNEPEWRAVMLDAPEVWGAQTVASDAVTMRVVVKTAPLRQWGVEREMRARLHAALVAAGIHFPPPSD